MIPQTLSQNQSDAGDFGSVSLLLDISAFVPSHALSVSGLLMTYIMIAVAHRYERLSRKSVAEMEVGRSFHDT